MKFFLVALFLVVSMAGVPAVEVELGDVDVKGITELNEGNKKMIEGIARNYFDFRQNPITSHYGHYIPGHNGVLCFFTIKFSNKERRVILLRNGLNTNIENYITIQPPLANFVYKKLNDGAWPAIVEGALSAGIEFIETEASKLWMSSFDAVGYAYFLFSGDNGEVKGDYVFFAVLYTAQ